MKEGLRVDGPTQIIEDKIILNFIRDFKEAEWTIPEDFLERSHFDRVIRSLDYTSSPGYPYLLSAPSNRILFKVDENGNPDKDKVDQIYEAVMQRISGMLDADPIRIFIKAEPHKLKKIEAHKYRLISSISVIDQIIDHLLFDTMNDLLVENWPVLPSKVGYSHLLGGWKTIPLQKWMATDKSGWDWTVRPWLLQLVLQCRKELCTKGKNFDRWCELADYRYSQLYSHPEFILSNGHIYKQRVPGVLKSGSVNTITDNSIMQYLLHVRVQLEMNIPITPIYAMGDDVLQIGFPEFRSYLERIGQFCIIKQAAQSNEFAGFEFKDGYIEPLYKGKHAFVLRHVDPKILESLALSYSILYHRSKMGPFIKDLFRQMNVMIFEDRQLDLIVDGEE